MSTKKWIVIATALLVIGLIIFTTVMSIYKWDFTKLSTGGIETKTHYITEQFSNISINTDTANVIFLPSKDDTYTVECFEADKITHTVKVENETLIIDVVDERRWYDYIGITFNTNKITITIPQGEYGILSVNGNTGDLTLTSEFCFKSIDASVSTGDISCFASASDAIKFKASTGSIRVENLSASMLDLTVTTGQVTVSDVNCTNDIQIKVSTGKTVLTNIGCENLISTGNTGDISLANVIANDKFTLERTTGNIVLKSCNASEIFMKTSTGDVEGSLLTDKIFITHSSTGNISVPNSTSGGTCEIHTSTGDITMSIN